MNLAIKQKQKNKFGQYFTPKDFADFMIELADIRNESAILEPSCGEGIFLELLQNKGYKNLTAFEIDTDLANDFDFVRYESFVSAEIEKTFDLVIGNPPYIRWANLEQNLKDELLSNELWNRYFNSLCDYLYIFILKSIELLNENGQLIFICPEYWLNTTHSISLRNYMVENGYFEEIYHFNETPIFDNVRVSIIIFKFVKSKSRKSKVRVNKYFSNQRLTTETLLNLKNRSPFIEAEYIDIDNFKKDERWLLTNDETRNELVSFEISCRKKAQQDLFSMFDNAGNGKLQYHTVGEFFDIGNGLVSGLDKAFQLDDYSLNAKEEEATIKVIKAKDLKPYYHGNVTKYIFLKEGLSESDILNEYPTFFKHLVTFKPSLENRYQYNKVIGFWEWVFLRNFNLFSRKEKRIFVPCKERISNKDYFRFTLVSEDIYPTQDVTGIFKKEKTKESIEYATAYLNNKRVFDWLRINGIVKGSIVEFSEKPISSIPFRPINWQNPKEVAIHDKITDKVREYIETTNQKLLEDINNYFDELLTQELKHELGRLSIAN